MSTQFGTSRCGQCSEPIDEPIITPTAARKPCARCGSISRNFALGINSTIELRSSLKSIARPTVGKWFHKQFQGARLQASGLWADVIDVYDRRGNRRRERVVLETGEVIRDVDHPLTDHKGHGSDKGPRTPGT